MLGVIGWVLVGAILTGALLYFWNDIKEWLNNTAADVVQRYIGYDARQAMQRAICVADRVVNMIRTRSQVYYKRNRLDTYYDKVVLEASAPVYEFDVDILLELDKKGKLEQEFQYRG